MQLSKNINRINIAKQSYNEKETINEEFVAENTNVQPLKYIVINVNHSIWEVVAVPLIFLSKETQFTFVICIFQPSFFISIHFIY